MIIRLTTYKRSKDIPPLPGNDVFHSTALFQIFEQTSGYSPTLLVASDNGTPIAKMLCITRRSFRLPTLADRTYVYGVGEYFLPASPNDAPNKRKIEQEQIFNEMLTYLTQKLDVHAFTLEFRNIEEPLFGYRYFRENGYFPMRWLRVRNSIHHNTIDKWMSNSRKRQIQRGLKNGSVISIAQTRDEVTEFFTMLKKYYSSKINHHLPDLKFFISLLEHPEGERFGKIYLVKLKDKIIGGSVCLFSKDTSYLMFSAGLRKSYPLNYPGVLCIWGAMTDARQRGFEHFEFIDAGLPFANYGYRDFILRFGGKQMSTRRWYKLRWNWLNKLLIKIYV